MVLNYLARQCSRESRWRALTGLWIVAVATTLAQCAPTSPSPTLPLAIDSRVHALKQGETYQFASTGAAGRVRWRSAQPSVCAITDTGVATAIKPGKTMIFAVDQSREVSLEVTVVPSLDGEWTGQAQVASFSRISGFGPVTGYPIGVREYRLHLEQTHDLVSGHDYRIIQESLSGAVDVNGSLSLSGNGIEQDGDVFKTLQLSLRLSDAATLSGDWIQEDRFTNIFGLQVYEIHARAFDMVRTQSVPLRRR